MALAQQVEPGGAFAAAIVFIAPSSPVCSGFGFDMFRSGESFVSLSVNEVGQAWPAYNVILNVGYGCKTVFAPLVMRSPIVSESSH